MKCHMTGYISNGLCLVSVYHFCHRMNHIAKHHINKVHRKSTFVAGLDVDQLIQDVLTHPLTVKRHVTKPNRRWFMGRFSQVIGYRGIDSKECRWVVVLMEHTRLITAYPIPHPKTLKFMR